MVSNTRRYTCFAPGHTQSTGHTLHVGTANAGAWELCLFSADELQLWCNALSYAAVRDDLQASPSAELLTNPGTSPSLTSIVVGAKSWKASAVICRDVAPICQSAQHVCRHRLRTRQQSCGLWFCSTASGCTFA